MTEACVAAAAGAMLPPAPYGTYPYVQPPAPVLPAATMTTLAPRVSTYYPPIFYWSYPSPPVSPTTYYPHSAGPTMVILRGLPYSSTPQDILTFFQGFPEVRAFSFFSLGSAGAQRRRSRAPRAARGALAAAAYEEDARRALRADPENTKGPASARTLEVSALLRSGRRCAPVRECVCIGCWNVGDAGVRAVHLIPPF